MIEIPTKGEIPLENILNEQPSGVYPTWEELLKLEEGTILKDWMFGDIRCIILRGPASLCAYMGINKDHRLAGKDYDNMDIPCHYGLTFSAPGDEKYMSEDRWWYGWDYAHAGDYPFYEDLYPFKDMFKNDPLMQKIKEERKTKDIKWTVEKVEADMQESMMAFYIMKYRSEAWLLRAIDFVSEKINRIKWFFNRLYWKLKHKLRKKKPIDPVLEAESKKRLEFLLNNLEELKNRFPKR